MKIILVNILLVSAVLGFSSGKSITDISMNTPTVETVSNIPGALNRDIDNFRSFEKTALVLSDFNFEYPRIYNKPEIENNKSSYLRKNKSHASHEASQTLKI